MNIGMVAHNKLMQHIRNTVYYSNVEIETQADFEKYFGDGAETGSGNTENGWAYSEVGGIVTVTVPKKTKVFLAVDPVDGTIEHYMYDAAIYPYKAYALKTTALLQGEFALMGSSKQSILTIPTKEAQFKTNHLGTVASCAGTIGNSYLETASAITSLKKGQLIYFGSASISRFYRIVNVVAGSPNKIYIDTVLDITQTQPIYIMNENIYAADVIIDGRGNVNGLGGSRNTGSPPSVFTAQYLGNSDFGTILNGYAEEGGGVNLLYGYKNNFNIKHCYGHTNGGGAYIKQSSRNVFYLEDCESLNAGGGAYCHTIGQINRLICLRCKAIDGGGVALNGASNITIMAEGCIATTGGGVHLINTSIENYLVGEWFDNDAVTDKNVYCDVTSSYAFSALVKAVGDSLLLLHDEVLRSALDAPAYSDSTSTLIVDPLRIAIVKQIGDKPDCFEYWFGNGVDQPQCVTDGIPGWGWAGGVVTVPRKVDIFLKAGPTDGAITHFKYDATNFPYKAYVLKTGVKILGELHIEGSGIDQTILTLDGNTDKFTADYLWTKDNCQNNVTSNIIEITDDDATNLKIGQAIYYDGDGQFYKIVTINTGSSPYTITVDRNIVSAYSSKNIYVLTEEIYFENFTVDGRGGVNGLGGSRVGDAIELSYTAECVFGEVKIENCNGTVGSGIKKTNCNRINTVSYNSIKKVNYLNYTILSNDGYDIFEITTGAVNRTITLPALADNEGRLLTFIKVDTGEGQVVINGTINGKASISLSKDKAIIKILAGKTEWKIITIEAELPSDGLFKNAIINPDGAIAQRGASGGMTFTAATTPANNDDTYLIDRWNLLSDGNDVVDISQSPAGNMHAMKFLVATINKKFGMIQIIENKNSIPFMSKKVSISFQAKTTTGKVINNIRCAILSWDSTADTVTSDVVSAWNAQGTNPTLVANWTYENVAVNLSLINTWQRFIIENISIDTANMANLALFIWCDDTDAALNDELFISQVQINEGSMSLPFQPKQFEEELALCQRYYCKSYDIGTSPGTATTNGSLHYVFSGVNSANYSMGMPARYVVSMRVSPTVRPYDMAGAIDKVSMAAGNGRTATVLYGGENGFHVSGVNGVASTGRYIKFHYIADAEL